jgi:hypothetical protein
MERETLFLMENRQLPWGDYGDILWSGFAPLDENTNRVYIERVGPFTPDIYISGSSLIFTKKAKDSYESSGLLGVEFLYIAKKMKVVNIDWCKWKHNKNIDNYIDDIGEPEDIINNNKNDEILLSRMPEYWVVNASHKIHLLVNAQNSYKLPSEYLLINDNVIGGVDFFSGIEYLGYFVTYRFKQWVDKNFPEHFEFFPIVRK